MAEGGRLNYERRLIKERTQKVVKGLTSMPQRPEDGEESEGKAAMFFEGGRCKKIEISSGGSLWFVSVEREEGERWLYGQESEGG